MLKKYTQLFKSITREKITQIMSVTVHENYRPTPYLQSHIFQSLYDHISPSIKIDFNRERVYFMDGGHVSLDWAERVNADKGSPIVLIMHGMTGGSETKYIRALVQEAKLKKYCSVCLNSRGINSEMTSPIPFIGFEFHELEAALKRIKAHYPSNPIYLIGTSLGGNYLLRYLTKQNSSRKYTNQIQALALLCTPFDVNYVVDQMNKHYQKYFIRSYLENSVLRHEKMKFWWDIGLVDLQSLKKSGNLREFHERITIKLMGFEDSRNFFDHFKITEDEVKKLQIPTFMLSSKDDPMVGFPSYPLQAIKANKNISFNFTEKGGHLCWFSGFFPQRWYPKPVFNFFEDIKVKEARKQKIHG